MKAGASVAAERRVRGLWRQLARRLLDEYAMICRQRADRIADILSGGPS
jgi:hypothetical protein